MVTVLTDKVLPLSQINTAGLTGNGSRPNHADEQPDEQTARAPCHVASAALTRVATQSAVDLTTEFICGSMVRTLPHHPDQHDGSPPNYSVEAWSAHYRTTLTARWSPPNSFVEAWSALPHQPTSTMVTTEFIRWKYGPHTTAPPRPARYYHRIYSVEARSAIPHHPDQHDGSPPNYSVEAWSAHYRTCKP